MNEGASGGRSIAMWVDPVEFAGFDQGRDDGPVLRPGIVTCKERVFAVERNWTDRPLDGVVVEFDATVVKDQDQPVPVFCDVFQGLSGRRVTRHHPWNRIG